MHSIKPLAGLTMLLIASMAARSRAQALPVGDAVTLKSAIAAALRDNPDVLLARVALDSSRAEKRIATTLPNPTLSATPNSPFQYAASIPLDLGPSRIYRSRAATLGVEASDADAREAVRQITLAVAKAFVDALLAERRRDITGERRTSVHQLLVADSVRFRSGEIPFHNLVRSEVEMARADADYARTEVDVQAGRFALQALMGRPRGDTAMSISGSLDYRPRHLETDSLIALAFANRPDLAAAGRRADQSRAGRQFATSLLVPTPVISYVRQYAAPFDNGHYSALGIAFELPGLNWFGGERARAAAGESAARLERRRTEIQVERDVTSALSEFRIQRALVERYQDGLLAHIDESVKAVRYAYSIGASSLLDVLDAVRSQQDVRVDYYTALHDYWLSVYGLSAAVGSDVFGIDP